MKKELQILYVEDNSDDAGLTIMTLKRSGLRFNMELVETEKEFISAITRSAPDLILSDHSLPGFTSIEAFKIMSSLRPGTPFILLTGSVSEQFALDCLLMGIDDYILKSNLIRLPSSIERVLSKKQISREKELIQNLHVQLQEAYEEIGLKNKEITDSINCAKRIQDAILPHSDQVKEEFSASFVIYKPRDIVSGDLYWCANTITTDERGLPLKIMAAADCTGHGVPGAFMSLLVSELLNQTIKNPNINSPADVLSHLNVKLPASLNKNCRERITDGLDMAICAIDPLRRVVYFAGANRPLWIVRRNGQGHDVLEYKGTKASIGDNTPPGQLFENNTIALSAGDRLFLFTDGVTDQFGGPFGKKLGRQMLREALAGSAGLPMPEQKEYLEKFLADWKGTLEQVDDILLIGLGID
jgi:serine phosphatase RsbU (regulator of sigma subunit)